MHFDRAHDSTIRQRVRTVLLWVTGGVSAVDSTGGELLRALGPSPALDPESVLLLTCLAPGVDQLAAEVALELGIPVRAALPFPAELPEWQDDGRSQPAPLYRNASTFRRGDRGDEQRLAEYDEMLRRIGVNNVFAVRQAAESECSEPQWVEQLSRDLPDPLGRRRRYRAAGEYLADQCQVLIAVCDREHWQSPSSTGQRTGPDSAESVACADVVLDAHLRGLRPGRLAAQRSAGWVRRGTVIRIFLPREGVLDREDLRTGSVAIWTNTSHLDVRDDEQLAELHGEALNLNRWHRRCQGASAMRIDGGRESQRMLPDESRTAPTLRCLLQRCGAGIITVMQVGLQSARSWWSRSFSEGPSPAPAPAPSPVPEPATKLQTLARQRRCASRINQAADGNMKTLRRRLLCLAGVVMLLLQLSQYWVPIQLTPAVNTRRLGLLAAAGCGLWISWVLYLQSRRRGMVTDQDDYRVLSEALRVQFYWTAGGTGQLVSQYYLQHQRGGLSWIRAAVSSAAMPVSEDRVEFLKLSSAGQRQRLEQIRRGWLEEQTRYFENKSHELTVRQRWLTFFAKVLLFSGLVQLGTACVLEFTEHENWLSDFLSTLPVPPFWPLPMALLPVGLLAVSSVIVFLFVQLLTCRANRQGYPVRRTSGAAGWLLWIEGIVEQSWTVFAATLLFSGACLVAAYGLPETLSQLPSGRNLNQILRNLSFAGAGLLQAAMSFSFLSRNIAHYSSMAQVFRRATGQLTALLTGLTDVPGDARDQQVRQIQQLLVDLGTEALNENSDWLQRHRAAPVTPLMPSG